MNSSSGSICFELPNLPGTLEPVVTALANAGVNINSILAHGGHLVLSVDDPDALRSVLRRETIAFHEVSECSSEDRLLSGADWRAKIRSVLARLENLVNAIEGEAIAPPTSEQRLQLARIGKELADLAPR